MSIRHPFGETDLQTIYAAGGTLEIPISCGTTILETQTLTSNCTINLDVDSDIQLGAEILIKCTTNGTETFTFGTGIDAPTITGVAGKTWSQSFIYNGSSFVPEGVHSFTESLCPSITLGALVYGNGIPYFIKDAVLQSATSLITGGTAPFTPTVTGGSLPPGTSLDSFQGFGNNYIRISGTPTTFGSSTFTIGGTDANGCAITPREYTIEVWLEVTNSTPDNIDIGGTGEMILTVSGLPESYGDQATIESVTINSLTFPDLSVLPCFIIDPDSSAFTNLTTSGQISGANLLNTKWLRGNTTNISTGTAPFTGSFSPTINEAAGFDVFNGSSINGNWTVGAENQGGVDTGTINSVTILFKPI